jgi:hypothetical protein
VLTLVVVVTREKAELREEKRREERSLEIKISRIRGTDSRVGLITRSQMYPMILGDMIRYHRKNILRSIIN